MYRVILFTLLLSFSFSFAQKRAFHLDDLYKIKSVSDVQISPDGKHIAFTVKKYNLSQGTTNSEIYLMNADGSNQRQLTNSPGADYHPRWHKDSKHLLFISDQT